MCDDMKRVAFILGAVDGDVVAAARRLVKILRMYQWVVDRLSDLIESTGNEALIEMKKDVLRELHSEVKTGLVIQIGVNSQGDTNG